jgi:hypothetical protein
VCRPVGIGLAWVGCASGSLGLRTRTPHCERSSGLSVSMSGWRPNASGWVGRTSGCGPNANGSRRSTSGCAVRWRGWAGRPSARPPVLQRRPHRQPQACRAQARRGLWHPRPPAPARAHRPGRGGGAGGVLPGLRRRAGHRTGGVAVSGGAGADPAAGDLLPGPGRPLPVVRPQGAGPPPGADLGCAGRGRHPAWSPGGGVGGLAQQGLGHAGRQGRQAAWPPRPSGHPGGISQAIARAAWRCQPT